jgi:hypothetical protein
MRRVLLAIVVLGVLLVVVPLIAYRGRAPKPSTRLVVGRTAQGLPFKVEVSRRDGTPLFVTTRVRAVCPGALDWFMDWHPHATADGHVASTWFWRYPGEIGEIRMTLDGDPALTHGVLTFTERFTQPGGRRFICASGPVPFGASVSGLRIDSEDRTT